MMRVSLPGSLCFAATVVMMMRCSAIAEATAADQHVQRSGSEDGPAAVFIERPACHSKCSSPYLLVPRSPRGAQPKNKGLILEVEFDRQNYLLGEPLLVRCSLVNYGAKPIELSYDRDERSQNTFLFKITAPDGKQVPPDGDSRVSGMLWWVEIPPGHRLVALYNLYDELAIQDAGDYKISVCYRSDGWWSNRGDYWRSNRRMHFWRDDLWRGNLEQSLGTVRILSPTKDVDKAALDVLGTDSKGRRRRTDSKFPFRGAFYWGRRPPDFIEKHGDSRYAAYARYFAALDELAWAERRKATSPEWLRPAIAHLKVIDTAGFPRLFQEYCLFHLLYAHAFLNAVPPASVSKQRFLEQFPDSPLVFALKLPQFKDLD